MPNDTQKTEPMELEPFRQGADKRLAFARAYASNGRNGPAAYAAAGFKGAGNVGVAVSQLLRRQDVQAELRRIDGEAIEDVRKRAGISLERTLKEIASQAFFDPRKLFHEDGTPKGINELDDVTAAAIEGVDVQETRDETGRVVARIRKYKLARKTPALDMLMKHLGGYEQDNKQKGEGAVNALVELLGSMKRSTIPVAPRVDDDHSL